jgi:LmbE family N-acetylglucosaminyl deacetylase
MKILAIGAHLDDIELACGGTLAKATNSEVEVLILVLSDSAYADFSGKMMRTRMAAKKEGQFAAKKLKAQLKILNFKTKKIGFDFKTVEAIERELVKFGPDLILSHWPGDYHQDHKNVALSTLAAARRFPNVLIFEPFYPSFKGETFEPNFYVDISKFIDQKISAIKEHKTECKKYGPVLLEGVYARARFHGSEIRSKYAETFKVLRMSSQLMGL